MMAGKARMYGRFSLKGRDFVGELAGGKVSEIKDSSMEELIELSPGHRSQTHRLSELRVLAPLERPSKMVCIGLNYRSHIREMGWDTPVEPIIFSKPSSSIIGPDDHIVLPAASKRVDYEGESAIVIGKRATRVSHGSKYIFGYTCINDVTARDLQEKDVDWTRAKGFDTFAPMGPYISTAPPTTVTTRLNGKVVQRSALDDRVFQDAALVEYISTVMTLKPGDVIATGTPSGIGKLAPGDTVEVDLDTVGTLRNRVFKSR